VNNVWGGYEHYNDGTEFWTERGFWTEPLSRWDSMFAAGVRAHFAATGLAVPMMIERRSGVIVFISSEGARRVDSGVAYSAAKAATDRLAACVAHELHDHRIAAISLYPGLVRTEAVLKAGDYFDLTESESPEFVGRIIVALAADPEVLSKSGQTTTTAELAAGYGLTDP
jgi:NAD(P)-dependent dehydrogenase (short-subunit alcohol dehydrogenase family)